VGHTYKEAELITDCFFNSVLKCVTKHENVLLKQTNTQSNITLSVINY